MSDLIDFDSPNLNNVASLLSPLIPAPDITKNNNINLDETGSHFFEFGKRHSSENNPFDSVMKKITEYEINNDDPFEKVISKAMGASGRESIESMDDFVSRHNEAKTLKVFEVNKNLDNIKSNLDVSLKEDICNLVHKDNDISIITDLNNTNLINDNGNHKNVMFLENCDNKVIPNINVSSASYSDLSILNNSVMNDSLLDQHKIVTKNVVTLNTEVNLHAQSMTEFNFISPKKMVQKKSRRAMSVCEISKNSHFGEDMLSTAQSSVLEDPLNNAFRKISSTSNTSSETSYLSNQFNLNTYKQKTERLNSDSSVFSGLSNISAITADSLSKLRNERLHSESSTSGISNLSIIPTNHTTSSSCNSATFSNDTANKGFIASRLRLNSTTTEKSCSKPISKSDVIKKFIDIKTRISVSQIESQITTNKQKYNEEENRSLSKHNISINNESTHNNIEKLVDIDNSSVFIENGVNEIISQEANVLAETFEKMSSTKETNFSVEDELLSSLTQFNFDELPPSDDEAVENLIELAPSSLTSISNIEETKEKNISAINVSPKDNVISLENEFSTIELKNVNKKADAATLLWNLKNIIEQDYNPDASKMLEDLQKLLGINCDNNTDILKICLQNTNSSYENKNKSQIELQYNENTSQSSAYNNSNASNDSNEKVRDNCRNNSFESKQIIKMNENDLSGHSSYNKSELPKNLRMKKKTINESQNTKEPLENTEDLDESTEDQKLAINFLRTLNKILNKKSVDTTDVLRSLGTVLNMATGMRVNDKEKQTSKVKENERRISRHLNNSTSTLYKSPSRKSSVVKSQNKSFEILPLRRSTSINPVYNNNLLDKRKSHLINIKKRFPSDPGFINPTTDIKNKKCGSEVEQKCLKINKNTVAPIKQKWKKTQSTESITKKGPLKAIIPLGNMQKRVSISQKISDHNGEVTPPRSTNICPSINIPSSTPNTSIINSNSKSKPKASSTPNAEELKIQNTKIQVQQISKKTLSSSPKGKIINSKINLKSYRMEKSLSPQKRPLTLKKNLDNSAESRLPKYSPRPKKIAKSPQKVSRFVTSNSIRMDPEKENHV